MAQRLQLQSLLEEMLGTRAVYFQPPANVQMEYPCIVYNRDTPDARHAGNILYRYTKCYQITYIDRDPDSDMPDKLAALPMCSFDTSFTANNLNHYVLTLYF